MSTAQATTPHALQISVVTPTLDAEAFLEACLASVEAQWDDGIEHVVVDGGSSDGTLSILAAYPQLRVLRQEGRGLYQALNQGVAAARGQYTLFLNGDDLLLPGAIAAARKALSASERIDLLYGPVRYVDEAGDELTEVGAAVADLAVETLCFGIPALNAKLIRRDRLLAVGGFDTRYAIAGDRAMLLKLARTAPVCQSLGQPLTAYRRHPGSLTLDPARRNRLAIHREHVQLAQDLIHEAQQIGPEREMLAGWQALERAKLIAGTLASGRAGDAAGCVREGFAKQPLWPFRAILAAPKWWRVRKAGRPGRAA